MKISKSLAWIKPFLNDASKKNLFKQTQINKIIGYRLNPKFEERQDAQIIMDKNSNTYVITIRTHHRAQSKCGSSKFYQHRIYLYDCLDALAHELAHTKEWEHTLKHADQQFKIMKCFLRTAKRLGINDLWKEIPIVQYSEKGQKNE